MQITGSSATFRLAPAQPKPPAPPTGAAIRPDAPGPQSTRTSIFKGGLVDWSNLITPDTLRAMFELDADGSVKVDAQGTPLRAADRTAPWTRDESLIVMRVRGQAMDRLGIGQDLVQHVSDEQKRFFRAVTGYNLVVEGNSQLVIDDEGRPAPDVGPMGGPSTAPYQLAGMLALMNADGQNPAAPSMATFESWLGAMSRGGVAVPSEWLPKARAHLQGAAAEMVAKELGEASGGGGGTA